MIICLSFHSCKTSAAEIRRLCHSDIGEKKAKAGISKSYFDITFQTETTATRGFFSRLTNKKDLKNLLRNQRAV